jgi:hypothetical protein
MKTTKKSATFNRSRIMRAAHATAKWRVASVGGSYREWFAKALSFEWKKAKGAHLRDESNIGLPLRTCAADAPVARTHAHLPSWWGQAKRNAKIRRLYTRDSGRRAGMFAA